MSLSKHVTATAMAALFKDTCYSTEDRKYIDMNVSVCCEESGEKTAMLNITWGSTGLYQV